MSSEQETPLTQAARRRSEQSRRRVADILRRAEAHGGRVTVAGVSSAAHVSRTYLYSQPDLLEAIAALRADPAGHAATVPRRQRATEGSLLQRIAALTDKNKPLRAENTTLRKELAAAYGQLRDTRHQSRPTT